MKTVLICHHDDDLNRLALPRWLGSFSDVVGVVILRETSVQKRNRIKRELKRVGRLRFLDVLAFRLHYRIFSGRLDQEQERLLLDRLFARYPALGADLPTLVTHTPNGTETREFLERLAPDLMIARCKVILKPEIFSIPRTGTFVLHPGICPEYRNAHGCFWALAQGEPENVGLTLLKVDAGIDTGPIYGYYRCEFDERRESHLMIQSRSCFDNLEGLRDKLLEIHSGRALPIDTRGRRSANWGQPWLSRHLGRRLAALRPARQISLLYHDVLPEGAPASASGFAGADADIYKLTEGQFERHLHEISQAPRRPDVVTLAAGRDLPRARGGQPPVLFTFDDGGSSAIEPTARQLEALGWRGHFFVVSSKIGQPGFLSIEELRSLRARGHVIGSHSHTHPAGFSRLTYARQLEEWRRSRELLEEWLGEPVWCASVPGGYYSAQVAAAAREAGYSVLFNSEPEARVPRAEDGLLILGRYGIQRTTSPHQAAALARAARTPRALQWFAWNLKKPLKTLGGSAWLRFRKWYLLRLASGDKLP